VSVSVLPNLTWDSPHWVWSRFLGRCLHAINNNNTTPPPPSYLHLSLQLHLYCPPPHLGHFWVNHVLVVVHHHICKGNHVAGQEVGAPALLAPKVAQVVERVHTCMRVTYPHVCRVCEPSWRDADAGDPTQTVPNTYLAKDSLEHKMAGTGAAVAHTVRWRGRGQHTTHPAPHLAAAAPQGVQPPPPPHIV
jgi:hypothetical protein